ncbi:MAG: hypothetical protein KC731_07885, partial [Myxococcales bacterium]|nr:hypothetical protein [Myxococcales bacterium]
RPPEPLPVGPLGSRLAAAEAGSRRDGATFVARLDYRADARGVGALSLRLREGCHRLHVASEARRADVDAEVRFPGDEEPLRLDRAHAPEARLDFCLGATRDVELRFAGASPSAAVAVMDAHWPLPDGVPSIFGDQARGGFAWALHRRPSPPLGDPPIRLVAGGVGVTQVPLPLEPGACYLAAMAVSRGEALGGRLTVELGARELHDDASDPQRAAAVAFCAGPRDRTASASVELRADQAFWGLALWKLVGGRP